MVWRAKKMTLSEWMAFQTRYEEVFSTLGNDKRMALFILQDEPGAEEAILLIPSHNSKVVEQLSPGGWQDHPRPSGERLGMLVGHQSAPEDFGITIGR